MLRLMLLRHAKSSWDNDQLGDHARPLNGRGRKSAAAVGLYMANKGLIPHRILCSTATRTRETLALVRGALPSDIDTHFLPALYDFGDGDTVIEVIRGQGAASSPLLVIGHNPAFEGAALSLSKPDDNPGRMRIAQKYPTAGLVVMDFDIENWAALEPGTGHVVSFTIPADLGI